MSDGPGAPSPQSSHHWMTRLVEAFLHGNLSILLILISLICGAAALMITAREEDPQIVVPVADVLVAMPGASAREVERQVSTRLEKLLAQIDGVEYVYSTSYPSQAVVTVRFFVGEDRERSYVKLQDKIAANIDQVPPGVTGWVVKPIEIDDVPIVNLTLTSAAESDYGLRRMAEELEIRLQGVKNAGRTSIVGGRPREISLRVLPELLASRGVTLRDIEGAVRGAGVSLPAGEAARGGVAVALQAGRFLASAHEVSGLVVAVRDGRPVYVRDVAEVRDGPAEAETYTRIAFGPQAFGPYDPAREGANDLPAGFERGRDYPSVTVAVAKRRGTNAVTVSREVQEAAARFAAEAFPQDVILRVTRDYGKSADDKVNELVEALLVAIVIVVGLLAWSLGWREGIIIVLAVPVTFAFTLLVNLLLGYTINRVTLFALILSLGLVVDDPIVDVENIHRHLAMRKESPIRAVVSAVNEVRPPVILATFAVIISFVPMFFITGMMGPYMAPMALNVPVAMLMSLLVAFTITPWLSLHLLKAEHGGGKPFVLEESGLYRIYDRLMEPLFGKKSLRLMTLAGTGVLLAFAVWLVFSHRVPLKMLPFDNKNELQVVVDMPKGTTLEETEAATKALAAYCVRVPEVTDVATYAGTASPMDFNGLIRHYFLRRGDNVADIRLNLCAKKRRVQQSHELALRLRNDLTAIARTHNANIKIVEVPPGPPVIATLVAEVRGSPTTPYGDLGAAARRVRAHMEATPGVVDVDDVLIAREEKTVFILDREKAALSGVSTAEAAGALQGLVAGADAGSLRLDTEVHPVRVRVRLPRERRSLPEYLGAIPVSGAGGAPVMLSELGHFEAATVDQPVYHKNLDPVVYVFGETAGLPPPDAVFALEDKVGKDDALKGFSVVWSGEGEWDITIRVFRDLGIAFGVAVLGIYILLLWQTGSWLLPAIQLIALPLSVIGIFPGFWLLNVLTAVPVGGWGNPVYFTATAMIGMIALSGIATRNAILLIEFVEERKRQGKAVGRSLIEAGALRTRPILLTSFAAMLGAWPITLDPIFSGLAWALIFGILVSTVFTLVIVPLVYFMAYGEKGTKAA